LHLRESSATLLSVDEAFSFRRGATRASMERCIFKTSNHALRNYKIGRASLLFFFDFSERERKAKSEEQIADTVATFARS